VLAMERIGFIAFSLCLFGLSACAISEPRAGGGKSHEADSKDNPVVIMETSMGTVKMELFQNKAPITVANFLKYVDAKHYDGTIFHRVMSGFMIQGGGFTPGLKERGAKFPKIQNEAGNGLSNQAGTMAMARTDDPNSATDQFFINVVNNSKLDRSPGSAGYAVFGRVTEGMDVVEKIRFVNTHPTYQGHEKVPVEDVIIKSIRRVETK
jgi:peptidyl-prolyl cis-trans isomerase A (cyclophilin A)